MTIQTIPLAAVASQTFSVTLDGNRYDFAVYSANGVMCCDISINETAVITGKRIVNGSFLIPFFAYVEAGNFMLLTDGALPDYTQFGATQTLVYLQIADIATAAVPAPIPVPVYAVA